MPPDILLKRWFAKTYGWTPRQVDDLSLDELSWLPLVEQAHDEAVREMSEQQTRAQQIQQTQRY
jgi:hypothetical protein